jgi:alkylated DNA nucleotide flippase Atl1
MVADPCDLNNARDRNKKLAGKETVRTDTRAEELNEIKTKMMNLDEIKGTNAEKKFNTELLEGKLRNEKEEDLEVWKRIANGDTEATKIFDDEGIYERIKKEIGKEPTTANEIDKAIEMRNRFELEEIKARQEITAKWRNELNNVDDKTFKTKLANNIDEIELSNMDELRLTKEREKILTDEINDRTTIRNHESELDEMENRAASLKERYLKGEITNKEYADDLVKMIERKEEIAKNADNIKAATKERFKDTETIKCAEAAAETIETVAEGAVTSYKAMAAGIGAGTVAAAGTAAVMTKKEEAPTIKIDRTPAKPGTREEVIQKAKEKGLSQGEISGALKMAGFEGLTDNDIETFRQMDWEDQTGLTYDELKAYEKVSGGITMSGIETGLWNSENMAYRMTTMPTSKGYMPYRGENGTEFISAKEARELIKKGGE